MGAENIYRKLENVQIVFPDLSGKVTTYNPNGLRIFGVVLSPDLASKMVDEGWTIKHAPFQGRDINFLKIIVPVFADHTWIERAMRSDCPIDIEVAGHYWEIPNHRSGHLAYLQNYTVYNKSLVN